MSITSQCSASLPSCIRKMSTPPKVEYSLTKLGRTLVHILEAIREWSEENIKDVLKSRNVYDSRTKSEAADEMNLPAASRRV